MSCEPITYARGGFFSALVEAPAGSRFVKAVPTRSREALFWEAWRRGLIRCEGVHYRLVPPGRDRVWTYGHRAELPEAPGGQAEEERAKPAVPVGTRWRWSGRSPTSTPTIGWPRARFRRRGTAVRCRRPAAPVARALGVEAERARAIAADLRAVEAGWASSPRASRRGRRCLAHMDLGMGNILLDHRPMVMLDFGHAGIAPVGADLHTVLLYADPEPRRRHRDGRSLRDGVPGKGAGRRSGGGAPELRRRTSRRATATCASSRPAARRPSMPRSRCRGSWSTRRPLKRGRPFFRGRITLYSGPASQRSRHVRDPSHPAADHRLRPGRLHRGGLWRAGDARADPDPGHPAGRAADDHHRGRELARRRRGAGAGADGADGGARQGDRRRGDPRPHRPARARQAAVHGDRRRRHRLYRRRGDPRDRGAGEVDGAAVGGGPTRASGSRPARPATASSSAAARSWWSAAATRRSRRRCS